MNYKIKQKLHFTVLATLSFLLLLGNINCKTSAVPKSRSAKVKAISRGTWQVDRLHHVINGEYSTYTRGGKNNTDIKYDNLRFKFNEDGTAIHIDQFGNEYKATWQFSGPDMRTLTFTINGHTDSWEMLEIAGDYLHASANLTIAGNSNNVETFRLVRVQ